MLRRLPHRLTLLRTGTVTAAPFGILVESSTGCKLGFHSGHNLFFHHPFRDLTVAEHKRRTAFEVGACSTAANGSRRYLRTGQFLVGSEIKQLNTTNNGVSPAEKLWRSKYDLLVAHLKKDGPSEHSMSQKNPSLHRWIERQRITYRAELKSRQKGEHLIQPVRSMSQERIDLLNKIQFDWGSMPEDQNEDTYDSHLIEWVSKGGDDIRSMPPKELPTKKIKRGLPSKKDTAINGKKVVKTENRVTKEIPTEQLSKRNKDKRKDKTKRKSPRTKWNEEFAQLVEFKEVTGHTDVPKLEGSLGKWVYHQRQNNLKEGNRSKKRQEQITKLKSIGFNFELELSDESMVSALKPVAKERSYVDLRTWDIEGPSLATKNHPPLHRWIMMERAKLKDSETKQKPPKPQKTKAKKKGSVKRSAKIKNKNQEQPALIEEDTPDKEKAIDAIPRDGGSQSKKSKRKNSTRKSPSVKRKNKNKKPPATGNEKILFNPQTVADEILRDQLLQTTKEESS